MFYIEKNHYKQSCMNCGKLLKNGILCFKNEYCTNKTTIPFCQDCLKEATKTLKETAKAKKETNDV